MEVQQEEDVFFNTEVVERVKVWLTRLIKTTSGWTRCRESGEADLKETTIKLQAGLHRVGGPGTLEK